LEAIQARSGRRAELRHPELNDILRHDTNAIAAIFQSPERRSRFFVLGVEAVDASNENVCIGQNIHLAGVVVQRVDALPA